MWEMSVPPGVLAQLVDPGRNFPMTFEGGPHSWEDVIVVGQIDLMICGRCDGRNDSQFCHRPNNIGASKRWWPSEERSVEVDQVHW